MATDIYQLNPKLAGWVVHVLCFIVPRQIVPLGDPSRRSCDACESLGASIKKVIRHLTCRRRVTHGQRHSARNSKKEWSATFTRGYIEQAFRRVNVRAELLHGPENAAYRQRSDIRLLEKGRVAAPKAEREKPEALKIRDAMEAPWVWSQEAALAVWS